MEKGGGFLRKLWHCLVGEYNRAIKYYHLSWWSKLATIKSFKAGIISFWHRASTRSNSFETLYGGQSVFLTQLIILNYPIIPSAGPGSHKLAAKQVQMGSLLPTKESDSLFDLLPTSGSVAYLFKAFNKAHVCIPSKFQISDFFLTNDSNFSWPLRFNLSIISTVKISTQRLRSLL